MSDASCPSFEPFRCPEEGKCISIQVKSLISQILYSISFEVLITIYIEGIQCREKEKLFRFFMVLFFPTGGRGVNLDKFLLKLIVYLPSICVTEQTTVRMVTMKTNCCVQQVGNSDCLQSRLYKLLEIIGHITLFLFPSTPTSS